MRRWVIGFFACLMAVAPLWGIAQASSAGSNASKSSRKKTSSKRTSASKRTRTARRTKANLSPWKTPDFGDPTAGDWIDFEDLAVRRAAVEALGNFNGSMVVTDAATGRILTIVNQKLAFDGGYQPCSTIKIVTAVAALNEKLITPDNQFRLSRKLRLDLADAIAHSNNYYFSVLGQRLGFERVTRYARLLGVGEKACLNVPSEKPGALPAAPPKNGGVGMMTSFGEGIRMTPLELAAMVGAIANGGKLMHLQYPRMVMGRIQMEPRIKRLLDFAPVLETLKEGMRGALLYGTARRAAAQTSEPLFGKTGTCTDYERGAHMGWFAAFNDAASRPLAVVVMLTGAGAVNGPVASGIAGAFFRNLAATGYLAQMGQRALESEGWLSNTN